MKCEIYKYKIEDLTPYEITENGVFYFEYAEIIDHINNYLYGVLAIDLITFSDVVIEVFDSYYILPLINSNLIMVLEKIDMYKYKIDNDYYKNILNESMYSEIFDEKSLYLYKLEVEDGL